MRNPCDIDAVKYVEICETDINKVVYDVTCSLLLAISQEAARTDCLWYFRQTVSEEHV